MRVLGALRVPGALMLALSACGGPHAPVAATDPCAGLDAGTGGLYDLNCEFSFTQNPHGAWSYGSSSSLAPDQFRLATVTDTGNPVGLWHPDARTYYPYVAWNDSAFARADGTNSWAVEPRQVAMEAAPGGRFSVVRFVAPQAGRYSVNAVFQGIHFRNSTTDVHVVLGDTGLFAADIDGYGGNPAFHARQGPSPVAGFARVLDLAAGEALSFAVGNGKDGANSNDTTGLTVHIER